jgi:glycosyltransferase involved in cell wall biosynthesis
MLLGRTDVPTDGVADYCRFLGQALARRGVDLKIVRAPIEKGWLHAILDIRRMIAGWRGNWILLQYTALGWSRRGFPLGAVATLLFLRLHGITCGVVFHEAVRQYSPKETWLSLARGTIQDSVIHALHRLSQRSIFTVPLDTISWLSVHDTKGVFIPLGANIPEPVPSNAAFQARTDEGKTVAVFCVSDQPFREREITEIAHAMRCASRAVSDLNIVFVGRGTREAQDDIARAFDGIPVKVKNLGLRGLDQVSLVLAESNAILCVRGKLNLRRASALAGIAAAVPILGYSGAATGTPLMDAGIEFVPEGDKAALGAALIRVLTDRVHWQYLHEKNLRVQHQYFSWNSIAASFESSLDGDWTEA